MFVVPSVSNSRHDIAYCRIQTYRCRGYQPLGKDTITLNLFHKLVSCMILILILNKKDFVYLSVDINYFGIAL